MAPKAKPWRVVHPNGTVWAVRFKTEDSAWSRVANFTGGAGRSKTPEFREDMREKGWRVKDVTEQQQ